MRCRRVLGFEAGVHHPSPAHAGTGRRNLHRNEIFYLRSWPSSERAIAFIIGALRSHSFTQRSGSMTPSTPNVTQLLLDWRNGDSKALDRLMPLIYDELRRIAAHYLRRERRDHTLQTSALVNEVYLRLVDQEKVEWKNRAHFFGVAAQAMRRILVDYARTRNYLKRGGASRRVSLDEAMTVAEERAAELIALDEALEELAKIDPRKSRVVELRCFGGLSVDETAEALGVSDGTVIRDWNTAKAWLMREMTKSDE